MKSTKLLNRQQVADLLGYQVRTLDNIYNPNHPSFNPNFPLKIIIGKRTVRWDASEVEEYIAIAKQSRNQEVA